MTTGHLPSVRDLVLDAAGVAPVNDDVPQLIARRVAAGRPTDESTDRDGVERAEPETGLARSGGHGPDAA